MSLGLDTAAPTTKKGKGRGRRKKKSKGNQGNPTPPGSSPSSVSAISDAADQRALQAEVCLLIPAANSDPTYMDNCANCRICLAPAQSEEPGSHITSQCPFLTGKKGFVQTRNANYTKMWRRFERRVDKAKREDADAYA